MHISIEITKATTKRLLILGVTCFVGLTVAVVYAVVPVTFADGNVLTAAQLNQNFTNLADGQAPAQVVANFNAAVGAGAAVTLGAINAAATQFDLRWAMQHAAAAGACAAASPQADSPSEHVVIVRPAGINCVAACAANTGGQFVTCRTQIAVGSILPTQAKAYTDVVSRNYNYSCSVANVGDELSGFGGPYTNYCCCYQ
jgi:hypothetical protein